MDKSLILLLLVFVLIVGCDAQGEFERDDEPLIQTEALSYKLSADGGGLATEISYSFENRTGKRVYLSNCNGSFSLHLERNGINGWEVMWSPVLSLCLSSPMIIEAGERFESTLNVWAGYPQSNDYPQFEDTDPSGIYRLVWDSAYSTYDADDYPFGAQLSLDERVSNTFTIEYAN